MSKKSRRRNKKILAALALAGGAAMLGKRGVAANVDSGRGSGLRDTVDSVKDVVAPAVKSSFKPRVYPGTLLNERGPIVKDVTHPVFDQSTAKPNRFGRLYKKGGRVTGIAKRGFGRALMKGKK